MANFYSDAHSVRGPRATRRGWLQSKNFSLWGYVGKVVVKLRHEQVNTVEIGVTSSWDSVPQRSGSREDAV